MRWKILCLWPGGGDIFGDEPRAVKLADSQPEAVTRLDWPDAVRPPVDFPQLALPRSREHVSRL
jgi:hypothetical protein